MEFIGNYLINLRYKTKGFYNMQGGGLCLPRATPLAFEQDDWAGPPL